MTSGNPTRLILTFAFPLLLGNIFQQLYNISDIIIVGRLLGVNALAAAGASAPIVNTLLLVTLGFTAGLCVITAQRFGAKDENGVRKSVTHSIVASIYLCSWQIINGNTGFIHAITLFLFALQSAILSVALDGGL